MTIYSSLRGTRGIKSFTLGLAAATSALIAAAPASAAPTVYDLTGTFTNDTTLSGSFSFDGSQTGAAEFSNINICSNEFCWNHVAYGPYDGGENESVYFNGQPNGYLSNYIYLVIPKVTVNGETAVTGPTLGNGTFAYHDYSRLYLKDGTITPAAAADADAAAVPEPAAWAMMILGMGTVGFAMRRRKVIAQVSYAA